jgi:hypothetical protein
VAAAAAVVVGEAGAAATATKQTIPQTEPARALVDARVQALLIGALRLVIAVAALVLARLRGLEPGPTAGLFALGCGLLLVALPASVTRRRGQQGRAEAQPLPPGVAPLPHRRALALAMYPSTIGLSAVTAVALVLSPALAAVLAGILAGLGLAALYSAGQLALWERELGGRLLAERGHDGRVFLAPGGHA